MVDLESLCDAESISEGVAAAELGLADAVEGLNLRRLRQERLVRVQAQRLGRVGQVGRALLWHHLKVHLQLKLARQQTFVPGRQCRSGCCGSSPACQPAL